MAAKPQLCVRRCHALFPGNVVSLETRAGTTFSLQELKQALEQHKPAVLFLCQVPLTPASPCSSVICASMAPVSETLHGVQGESSTGAHQHFAGVAEACRAHNTVCHMLQHAPVNAVGRACFCHHQCSKLWMSRCCRSSSWTRSAPWAQCHSMRTPGA